MPRFERDAILEGDCRSLLAEFPDDYFSACITDPPYNYEFTGRNWNHAEIQRRLERIRNSTTLVKNVPYGSGLAGGVRNVNWYRRNRKNILDYQEWCQEWGEQVFRTMRPGAYIAVFNSTRTIAHVQVALEEAGFYTRDILVWRRHAGIPKGLNLAEKMRKSGDIDTANRWSGWHSCLRNEWEAICLLQKPLIDNYINTLQLTGVGLLNATPNGSGFLSNIIEGISPYKAELTEAHCTVKPLDLMRYLVKLLMPRNSDHVILDPFSGTGTTCLAALEHGVGYVGIDINSQYCDIARKRLAEFETAPLLPELL